MRPQRKPLQEVAVAALIWDAETRAIYLAAGELLN
jgi:hypothetical protein